MVAFDMFKLSLLFSLLSNSHTLLLSKSETAVKDGAVVFPPSCNRIECPTFAVAHGGNGFEIRRYNSTVWMSTSPIQDISLVDATRTGFLQLFDYIQGKNNAKLKVEMTAPVITQIAPSDGPICESAFIVSFYVPKLNQPNPPSAQGLHAQKWKSTYVAVRQFSGFVEDYDVAEEAAALEASLVGTEWSDAVRKSREAGHNSGYVVAQYNSPFEFDNRVNEIWFLFDLQNGDVQAH